MDITKVNQRRWLKKSGQWLENVDQTHLFLASCMPSAAKKNRTSKVKPNYKVTESAERQIGVSH